MIILLHKVDAWENVNLLYSFSKISSVQLFKPLKKHATRSSFYLIARSVQPGDDAAKRAMKWWKRTWRLMTFDIDGYGRDAREEHLGNKTNEHFGDRLIQLGSPIWKTQADALSDTSYCQ